MRTVPPGLVFSSDQARRHGWSDPALRRAANAGRLVRVGRGWYAPPPVTGQKLAIAQAVAAVQSISGSVISDRSALLMHGLPVVGPLPTLPELTLRPGGSGRADTRHLCRATLRDQDVFDINGVPVTSVPRTLLDVARHHGSWTSVSAMDAALNRGRVAAAQLTDVLDFCIDWPGGTKAGRALLAADGAAESPLESVSRLVMRDLELPSPTLQATVLDGLGRECGRVDFYWDEFGVIGEADGNLKYDATPERSGRAVLIEEKRRQERLEDLGLVVVRWGWRDVVTNQGRLRARLIQGFRRGAARSSDPSQRLWSISGGRTDHNPCNG